MHFTFWSAFVYFLPFSREKVKKYLWLKPDSSYIFTFYDGLRSVFHSILYIFFLLWWWRQQCQCLLFQFRAKNQITIVYTLPANISFILVFAILYIISHVNKAGIYVRYKTHSNKALSTNNSSCTLSDRI